MNSIPDSWNSRNLDELVDVIDPHPSHRAPDVVERGIPFFGIGDLNEDGTYKFTKVRYVSESVFDEHIKRYVITSNSIGFGRVATIGKVIDFKKPEIKFVVSPTLAILEPKALVHRNYILHTLRSEYLSDQVDKLLTGSTRSSLGIALLRTLKVVVPTDFEQQKIAKILTTVDNLIEKTQALINKYTAIKQGMMSDLFTRGVDLSGTPDTNPNYGQVRPSYEKAPELYRETAIGRIPKGWQLCKLEEVADIDRGKFTHRPRDDEKCYGGAYPFIQTGSVTKANGGYISEYKQTLSDYGRSVSREFPAGTIAVTIAANIADTGILDQPMCFPDSVVGVVVDKEVALTRFVEVTIRMRKPQLDALAPLSAQKNINLEDLRPLLVALPSLEEQQQICNQHASIDKVITSHQKQLGKLKLQKKALMQDLLTGKVKVA